MARYGTARHGTILIPSIPFPSTLFLSFSHSIPYPTSSVSKKGPAEVHLTAMNARVAAMGQLEGPIKKSALLEPKLIAFDEAGLDIFTTVGVEAWLKVISPHFN
eukprot:Em0029g23a